MTSQQVPITQDERWRIIAYLERLAACVMKRDFDGYADMIALPFTLVTRETRLVRRKRDDLRVGFDIWVRTLDANDVTALVHRFCDDEHTADGGFLVDYDTDVLRGDQRALPTFKNLIILAEHKGGLHLTQMISGVSNVGTEALLQVDPDNTDPLFGRMDPAQDTSPRHA